MNARYLAELRKEAGRKKQILRLTFYPSVDAVPKWDTLTRVDDLLAVEFVNVTTLTVALKITDLAAHIRFVADLEHIAKTARPGMRAAILKAVARVGKG